MLAVVNTNSGLNELEGDYRDEVDDTEFFEDDDEADNDSKPAALTEEASVTTSSKRVSIKPSLVQAAKLRKTINDRLGVPTSPVTEKVAALAGMAHLNGVGHITANGHVGPGVSNT